MNLSSGVAYSNLVNVDSTEVPSLKRVLPNDAANSYLVHKIEGNQAVGDRMPLNRSPLSSAKIQNIKNWINHVFQVFVLNTAGLTTPQYLPGGDLRMSDGEFRLGFNIFRWF